MRDYYKEIDKTLTAIENYKYAPHSIDWCADRIDWCWKWRKITREQMESLAERVITVYKTSITQK